MADQTNPQAVEQVIGTGAAGGASQAGPTIDQMLAQMQALTNTVNELTNKLNTVSQALKEQSTTLDTNMEVSTVGNDDAFLSLRNERIAHSRLSIIAERVLAAGADHYADLLARSRDHFSALPPLAPRSASGPGTTAS